MMKRSPARQAAIKFRDAMPALCGHKPVVASGTLAVRSLYDQIRRRRRPPTASKQAPKADLDIRHLPEGERIYAIGDVHGRADLLRSKFTAIEEHLSRHPVGSHTIVLLGDYIDRGPHSRDVIEAILERRQENRVVALTGNHETLLLDFLSAPQTYPLWAKLGGAETLMSYGVPPPSAHTEEQLRALAATLREAMPAAHLAFLKELPLAFFREGFLFVHAGVRPNVPFDKQSEADLLWIRDDFLDHKGDFGAMIVHGHSRVTHPDIRRNRINIDTGAYISSRLTCLVLDASGLSFL